MEIGLDLNGVITDIVELKVRVAKGLYNVDIPPANYTKDFIVNKSGLLTLRKYRRVHKIAYKGPEWSLTMKPIEGALETISKLQQEGHKLRIISNCDSEAANIAKKLMKFHNLNLPFTGLDYGISKAQACEKLDVYMDDEYHKLTDLANTVPNLYLFSHDYNKNIRVRSPIKRIKSWEEFHNEIQRLN